MINRWKKKYPRCQKKIEIQSPFVTVYQKKKEKKMQIDKATVGYGVWGGVEKEEKKGKLN